MYDEGGHRFRYRRKRCTGLPGVIRLVHVEVLEPLQGRRARWGAPADCCLPPMHTIKTLSIFAALLAVGCGRSGLDGPNGEDLSPDTTFDASTSGSGSSGGVTSSSGGSGGSSGGVVSGSSGASSSNGGGSGSTSSGGTGSSSSGSGSTSSGGTGSSSGGSGFERWLGVEQRRHRVWQLELRVGDPGVLRAARRARGRCDLDVHCNRQVPGRRVPFLHGLRELLERRRVLLHVWLGQGSRWHGGWRRRRDCHMPGVVPRRRLSALQLERRLRHG